MKLQERQIPIRVRGSVAHFAGMMEDVLRRHDGVKSGWEHCHPLWLQAKLTEEIGEIGDILCQLYDIDGKPFLMMGDAEQAKIEVAIEEAVDVANIAMVIADVLADLTK